MRPTYAQRSGAGWLGYFSAVLDARRTAGRGKPVWILPVLAPATYGAYGFAVAV